MIKNILFILIKRFCVVFVIFLFFPACVNSYYFSDEFDGLSLDNSKWNFFQGVGSNINVEGGYLKLTANSSKHFPYLYNKLQTIPSEGNYEIEIKFLFPRTTYWGVGFGIGNYPIYYNPPLVEYEINTNKIYNIMVWQSLNDQFLLRTIHCVDNDNCSGIKTPLFLGTPNNQEHILNIKYIDDHYVVVLDGNQINNNALLNTFRRPDCFWIGNPLSVTNYLNWTNLSIDYIRVKKLDQLIHKNPIIIIPGLGASWDLAAILSSHDGNNWKIPNFVHVYDNLINSLKENGYEEDKNLFIFAYDWRKNINDLGGDLDKFILSLINEGKIKPDDKFNLIGHSMGGLVARAYSQGYSDEKVNQIITAGSPHLGSVNAYGLWEGGEVWGWPWWQRVVLELIIQINKQQGESGVDTIRRIAPSVKDLLPLWDYLKNNNDQILEEVSLFQRNVNLRLLNESLQTVDDKIFAWKGSGISTKEFLKVSERSWLDRVLRKWEDGKPIESVLTNDGDGTVVGVSALGGFSHYGSAEVDHLGVINTQVSIEKIFDELGLDKNSVVTNVVSDKRDGVFVALLRSPGVLRVCKEALCDDDLGIVITENKLFLLPGYSGGELSVQVVEGGDLGEYNLYLGRLGEGFSDWENIVGQIEVSGEVDLYDVIVSDNLLRIRTDQNQALERVEVMFHNLNYLLPGWDVWKFGRVIFDPQEKLDKRLRHIDLLRLELSRIIAQSQRQKRGDITETAIDLWKSLDYLVEILLENNNTISTKQYDQTEYVVAVYQGLVSQQLKKTDNYYAGILYEMAEKLISRANKNSISSLDLAMNQLLSARWLLTTAVIIK